MRPCLLRKALAAVGSGVVLLCIAPAARTADTAQQDDQKQTTSGAAASGQQATKNDSGKSSGTAAPGSKIATPNQRTTASRTDSAKTVKDSTTDAKKPVTVYRPPTAYRRPGAYQPYSGNSYPDPSYYLPYLPPLYLPPDVLYGPQNPSSASSGAGSSSASDRASDAAIEARLLGSAGSSPRGRAWLYISFGDGHFAAGRYAEAYDRYCGAAQAAPDQADAYFRQGFALSALGRYDAAAKVFQHGLALDSTWAKSGFKLKELYRANQTVKQTQLDQLAKAATDQPDSADLLLLVGLHLWCDGQRDRASPFFQRAVQLGVDPASLKGFLPPAK